MLPTYRRLNFGLALLAAAGLFALTTVTPLAQSIQLPSPTSHISDLANVIDPQTRTRLETVLANLKDKTKIELYVAMVDSTGDDDIAIFSQRLAAKWNIAAKTSRTKTLLLVVSAASKSSFTQFSRAVQSQLPDGVLGEMTYRMRGPLGEGRFTDAIADGVHVFVSALAEKIGFNAADLEPADAVAVDKPASDAPQTVLVSATDADQTRPRVVADTPKIQDPQPTPAPDSSKEPVAAPSATPRQPDVISDPAIPEPLTTETAVTGSSIKSEETKGPRKNVSAKGTTNVSKRSSKATALQPAQPPEDEEETVALTLVLPVAERIGKLKEFLDTHLGSKQRPTAIEYLVSAYAQLGDQKLKNGDTAGGVEQLLQAIETADSTTSDKLFDGVISQIPANLYLRGERETAFKAAQNIENKFGSDPKRLLAIASFYLGIERGDEAARLAESALKISPDLVDAHRIRALGLHISLRLDEAAAEYKRTVELDPTAKASRVSLADLYRAFGKPEQALALYNEELAADPKDRAARAGKVISLLELSRADEGNTELDAALKDDAQNLPLLTGAAYWFGAHGDNNKAFALARQAVGVESRYTWAQIALAHAFLAAKQPLDAERAMRYARQYGKFPTLSYELANVLATMGLYQEAVDVLRESFTVKDGQISTRLAGHIAASDSNFIDLLAPERRAGIFQSTTPDTAENAKMLKALLAFNTAITPAEGEKINETAAVEAAQEFASGTDPMRAFRQVYAASRLLRNNIGIPATLELLAAARKASDDALNTPVLTMAVQADEFRILRARAIAGGNVPDVADAPRDVLASILRGRIEDLAGWALFNQEKYPDALEHLKKAADVLPAGTPAWRSALWHLGAVSEQSGQKEQALDYYIRSYQGGEEDTVRRSVIEQLYRKMNGSLDGFEARLNTPVAEAPKAESPKTDAAPVDAPKTEPDRPKAEPEALPKPETTETPQPAKETSQPAKEMSEEELRTAASRLRSTIKITGRIVDANKTGIGNVTVVLISPSGSVLAATTNNEGVYSFTVAPSQKGYRLVPSKDGYSFTPVDRNLAALIDDQGDVNFTGVRP